MIPATDAFGAGAGAGQEGAADRLSSSVADDNGQGGGGSSRGDARDPEAGLPPPEPEIDANGGPARAGGVRWAWGRVVHWAVGPRPHPHLATGKSGEAAAGGKGAGGWTGPGGDRRSEEQVFRALLCLMDAGEKRRPTIATGPPGKEAAPMRFYYMR